jgi:hypothetical protein
MPRVRKLESLNDIIVASYGLGTSIDLIASTHNVSPGTIRNILIRHGVSLRKQGRRAKGINNDK